MSISILASISVLASMSIISIFAIGGALLLLTMAGIVVAVIANVRRK